MVKLRGSLCSWLFKVPASLAAVLLASGLTQTTWVSRASAEDAIASVPVTMESISGVGELQDSNISVAAMDQVTSVSQFSDVKPTDWAFQALQSLVERYGCIVGYPDKTFRGNRALTRYEFAAGLNACLDKIQELIAAATADFVRKEDLEVVKRLQEEFAAELASLRGRVEALEVRTATLEKQQFSTTTKLSGLAWFNLSNANTFGRDIRFEALPGPGGRIPAAAPDGGVRLAGRNPDGTPVVLQTDEAETTFSYLTWLTLNTSFTGRDLLVTQLSAGNGISPVNQFASAGFFNAFGSPFTDQTAGTVNGRGDVVIHDLFYSFPVGEKVTVTVGPRVNWYRHFDFNRYTFFLTGASSFDSIGGTQSNAIDRGSGAVVEWNISPQLRFAVAYLGENTEFLPGSIRGLNTSSDPAFGLFGGTNTTTAELTFSPSSTFNLRLMYTYSRLQAVFGQVGGAVGEPIPYGQLDGGPFGPPLKSATANHFAVNFDWAITKGFGIFGRYGYGDIFLQPVDGKVSVQSFQVGVGFPDLLKRGALGVVTYLVPQDIIRGRRFFAAGAGDGGTASALEASYYYPINDNIALVPAFYAIFNANNFDSNPNIYVFNLRTQFSF
ncbi:MAG: iron uptake porin [Leptolyngbyaceae cyanobacterium bins.349]|nr:iron uptake porin [Leptolyngbyaceae cyanobacterium bins.349]